MWSLRHEGLEVCERKGVNDRKISVSISGRCNPEVTYLYLERISKGIFNNFAKREILVSCELNAPPPKS